MLETQAPSDAELALLLQAVQDGDDRNALVDNEMLAKALDWPLTLVAGCLEEAKVRSMIWGMRSGQRPAPWYTDLEVTVQGKRFLSEHSPA